jgi:hypothetical protein
VTHVSIGDYFVKLLCGGDPEKERNALLAHARWELSEEQLAELIRFFEEEDERAQEVAGEAGLASEEGTASQSGIHH